MNATPSLNLEHCRVPYVNDRAFKLSPRMIASAEGMYYTIVEGRKVLDGPGDAEVESSLYCGSWKPFSRNSRTHASTAFSS